MTATTTAPSAPPLDVELERLLKRMRLPYIRRAAPELLTAGKAQRWDPSGVLKALLAEEVCGLFAVEGVEVVGASLPG